MTEAEALKEARRRWGENAHVRGETGAVAGRFLVGIRDGVLFYVQGRGETWEKAFALADGNEKKPA